MEGFGFPDEGFRGGDGGQRPEGARDDLHCLCACPMDLATDPRESRAAVLPPPLDAAPGELGLSFGTALALLPKATFSARWSEKRARVACGTEGGEKEGRQEAGWRAGCLGPTPCIL